VSLLPEKPAQFLGGVESRWHMAAFDPTDGYMGAVVYDGAPCPIKYFSVDTHLE
jgi:nitrite reductase/ring-hydroxylating ferredoxin subunit